MKPFVLIVTDDPSEHYQWARWLRDAGYDPIHCDGPESAACPRAHGGACWLRQIADVAVVEGVDASVLCTKVPDDQRTVCATEEIVERAHVPLPASRGTLVFAVERARASSSGQPGIWTDTPAGNVKASREGRPRR